LRRGSFYFDFQNGHAQNWKMMVSNAENKQGQLGDPEQISYA
jgi:hypothetical protein